MQTLPHYAALLSELNSMKSRLAALAYDFKEIAPRSELDESLIDALVASPNAMITEANALKSVSYDPTPESDEESDPDPE